ncbi:MAG: IS66 family insertion sequence element accessory protein TnpA [Sulfobacillus sp.]
MKTLESRRQYWRGHVNAWQRSGLSQAAYCNAHGLVARQLGYWIRNMPASHGVEAHALTMVPARVLHPLPVDAQALVLQNAQGWQLTLPATVSTAWLAALLRGLS